MAIIPISQFTAVASVGPNDVFILDQAGTTYKGTIAQIIANASLAGLSDVHLTNLQTGQIITYTGPISGWVNQNPIATFSTLTDVDATTKGNGKYLTYNATTNKYDFEYTPNRIDVPPSLPSSYDDEFTGTTLNTNWTTINGGTKTDRTQTVENGFLVLEGPTPGSSNELYGIYKACPSTPFTVTQKIGLESTTTGYVGPSLFIRGATGIFSFFIMGRNAATPQLWFAGLTTAGVFSTEVGGGYFPANPCYMRIQYDGTNFKVFASSTGNFAVTPAYTEAASAHVGTPTGFGIGFISQNQATTVSCDWFRVTTP